VRKIPVSKYQLPILLGAIVLIGFLTWLGFFLHTGYAHFFNYLKTHHLSPVSQKVYNFGSHNGGELTYVLLGDSLLDGVGVTDPGNTLPAIFAGNFQNQGKSGKVIKLAQAGATTKDVLNNQVNEAIEFYPDYILVLIGTNDVHNTITDWEFKKQYQKLVETLNSKTRAQITLVNIPYIGSDQILLPPWNTILDWRMQHFNKIIQEIAKKDQVPLIDIYTPTRQQFDKSSDLYSTDQFHPSDKGYKLWADIIQAQW
jgi:lysophospholipase L1-like esterase